MTRLLRPTRSGLLGADFPPDAQTTEVSQRVKAPASIAPD
jgi:hypothetical protein